MTTLVKEEIAFLRSLYSGNHKKKKTIATDEQLFTPGAPLEQRQDILKVVKTKYRLSNKKVNYIEIGVKYGITFKHILDNTTEDEVYAHGFDLFEDFVVSEENTHKGDVANMAHMKKRLNELGHNNFELYKGDSAPTIDKTLPELENCVVFIDANHTYHAVKNDYNAINKKIGIGSYIIFDDVNWPGVGKFVNEIKNTVKIIGAKRIPGNGSYVVVEKIH